MFEYLINLDLLGTELGKKSYIQSDVGRAEPVFCLPRGQGIITPRSVYVQSSTNYKVCE